MVYFHTIWGMAFTLSSVTHSLLQTVLFMCLQVTHNWWILQQNLSIYYSMFTVIYQVADYWLYAHVQCAVVCILEHMCAHATHIVRSDLAHSQICMCILEKRKKYEIICESKWMDVDNHVIRVNDFGILFSTTFPDLLVYISAHIDIVAAT